MGPESLVTAARTDHDHAARSRFGARFLGHTVSMERPTGRSKAGTSPLPLEADTPYT